MTMIRGLRLALRASQPSRPAWTSGAQAVTPVHNRKRTLLRGKVFHYRRLCSAAVDVHEGQLQINTEKPGPDDHMVLMDASNLIYRFHFANSRQRLMSSQNLDTTIVHHFLKYIFRVLTDEGPVSRAVVVFDGPGELARRADFPAYKSGRGERLPEIQEAMDMLPDLLNLIGIPTLVRPCTEADDLIATLTTRAVAAGMFVTIHSNDKDFNQLLSSRVRTEIRGQHMTEALFEDKFGFPAAHFTEYQALCGDATDSIPGVKKIGHVKATKLIQAHGTIENLYANLDDMKESADKRSLKDAGLEYVQLMRKLVVLYTDLDLPEHMDPSADAWIGYLMPPGRTGGEEFTEFCEQHDLKSVQSAFWEYCHLRLAEAQKDIEE